MDREGYTGKTRQRAILYASSPGKRRAIAGGLCQRQSTSTSTSTSALAVPNWFDLPVLLPEANPIAARIQRTLREKQQAQYECESRDPGFQIPKVSHLSAKDEADEYGHFGAIPFGQSSYSQQRLQTRKKRPMNRVGAGVKLERLDRKSRLKETLWRDLSKFGLWHLGDGMASVEEAAESILRQWQETARPIDTSAFNSDTYDHQEATLTSKNNAESVNGTEMAETSLYGSVQDPVENVFLTAIPTAFDSSFQQSRQSFDINSNEASVVSGNEWIDHDEVPEEDDDAFNTVYGRQREIVAPGLRRRERLKNLHHFVEKQLQKRLFKSWETIEIAFSSTGDLTIPQIIKFLQLSDVKLGAADAAKVQTILQKHVELMQSNQATASGVGGIDAFSSGDDALTQENSSAPDNARVAHSRTQVKAKNVALSYEGFRQIFHPHDPHDALRWRREFDREKSRQKQEKEIYDKELASLEEKVKKRLAESAKHMIEVLDTFKCDPLAIPWENETQRKELRAQFLEIIFRKPQRRRMIGSTNATEEPNPPSSSIIPEKLSTKLIRSVLLQKYSRNGHFESIEASTVAYLFHDFAADCIKKSVNRYKKKCATDLWPERQLIFRFRLKKAVFLEWRKFTKHAETLRQYVMRKFVAWKYLTRKRYEYYGFYRTCFWPFYVWKRFLQQMIIARGKSSFLTRLVKTYIQLRHFRAVKARYRQNKWFEKQVARVRKKKAKQLLQTCWSEWNRRTETKMDIYRIWKGQGHALQRLHKLYMVRVTFYIWRYYTILKKDLERRSLKCILSLDVKQNNQTNHQQWNGQSHSPHNTALWYGEDVSTTSGKLDRGISVSIMSQRASVVAENKGSVEQFTSYEEIMVDDDLEDEPIHGEPSCYYDPSTDIYNTTAVSDQVVSAVPALSRIMETELGQKIKRKSRLYDLCLSLYLKYREVDRREMIGNVIIFRQIGRQLLMALKTMVNHAKKNRFASDLGGFRILHRRFRQWMIGVIYKMPPACDANGVAKVQDDDLRTQSILEAKKDEVVLHWCKDREWRLQGIEVNPIHAQELRQDLLVILANDSIRMDKIKERELWLKQKQQNEEIFLRKEVAITMKIKAAQMQQAQQIMRTRGHRLHDTLDRVFDDLLRQQRHVMLKSSFRGLRVIVMLKYTTLLCRRAQLRNWLRLCQRFMYWEKHMNAFYELKLKFRAFRMLLKHVVWKWKHQSPGLSVDLRKRQLLVWKYEHFLRNHQLLDGTWSSSRNALTKYSPANTFHGTFFRWVQFTQFTYAKRQMVALARRKQDLWRMHTVFYAMKSHVKIQYTYESRRAQLPFLWRQCVVDLDAYYCKLIALQAQLPTTKLRKRLLRNVQLLHEIVSGSPTLKQLFQEHETEVRARLALENRLMFEAYNDRKVHHYVERSTSIYGAAVGRSFGYEKAPPYGSISEVIVLCGKKVDGISLVVKTNSSASHEGALHGNPFGNREVFALSKGEVLISIEGFASQTIYGLRFGTSTGRLSKWYGQCEKGTRFELRSEYAAKREEIVGIFGYADGTSLHALGAVFRQTTQRNIFEGLWLQIESSQSQQGVVGGGRASTDEVPLCDRQFAYFLQVRTCDVLSAMKRAHELALRINRMEGLPSVLTRIQVIMGLTRWLFNALAHGLVHLSSRKEEGKKNLQNAMIKRATGERHIEEGLKAIEYVDSFRDEDLQLNTATLGAKKTAELKEMLEQGHQKLALGKRLVEEAQAEITDARRILPQLPMTKRMMTAIRRMYKVVQTKDYIDQMDPDLRTILMAGNQNQEILNLKSN